MFIFSCNMFTYSITFFMFMKITQNTDVRYFSQYLYDISVRHFLPRGSLIVSYFELQDSMNGISSNINLVVSELLKQLQHSMNWSFLLSTSLNKEKVKIQEKHDPYIVLVRSVHDMEKQINYIKLNLELDAHSTFLIALFPDSLITDRHYLAQEILTSLWSRNIFNAVVLLPVIKEFTQKIRPLFESSETILSFEIYTYFPFKPPDRCGKTVEAVLIELRFVGATNENSISNDSLFFLSKIPRNFNGCVFRISTFEYRPMVMYPVNKTNEPFYYADGLEIRFVEAMLKAMNITPVYRPPPGNKLWGTDVGKNGTWNGIFGEVQRGESDMSIAVNVLDPDRSRLADAVYPYLGMDLVWHVPCPKPMPYWSGLIRLFSLNLWLAFILVYVIFSVAFWLLVLLKRSSTSQYSSLEICLLSLWALILNMSASDGIPNSKVIRLTFLLWALYCFIMNNLYQAFLTSYFVDPGLEPALTTENELLNTDLKLGFHPHMALRHTELNSAPYRHQIPKDNVDEGLKRLAIKEDLAFLISPYVAGYKAYFTFMTADGKPGFCHLEEVFSIVWMSIYLQKGSPLFDIFNKYVPIVWQTGLVDKWHRDIINTAIITGHRAPTDTASDGDATGFSLKNLQSAFYALVLGYIVCVFSLLIEFIHKALISLNLKGNRRKRPWSIRLLN
ncbi:Ionotropic receptor 216 [Blattella germanica]|nr:Ionotropic receptor 216 [Blattella germanica]